MSINSLLTQQYLSNQMTKQIAIELHKQGNNGEEILSILDTLTQKDDAQQIVDYKGIPTEF